MESLHMSLTPAEGDEEVKHGRKRGGGGLVEDEDSDDDVELERTGSFRTESFFLNPKEAEEIIRQATSENAAEEASQNSAVHEPERLDPEALKMLLQEAEASGGSSLHAGSNTTPPSQTTTIADQFREPVFECRIPECTNNASSPIKRYLGYCAAHYGGQFGLVDENRITASGLSNDVLLKIVHYGLPKLGSQYEFTTWAGITAHIGAALVDPIRHLTWLENLEEILGVVKGDGPDQKEAGKEGGGSSGESSRRGSAVVAPATKNEKRPSYVEEDEVKATSMLGFLCTTLHHHTTAALHCICPLTPCPLFAIRIFWGAPAMVRLFRRFLTHSDTDLRAWAIKASFRHFSLFHCLPPCQRYNSLAITAPRDYSVLEELVQAACPSAELDKALLNALFECLSGVVRLPKELPVPKKPLSELERKDKDAKESESKKKKEKELQDKIVKAKKAGRAVQEDALDPGIIDLFHKEFKNPVLLPTIFRALKQTTFEFRFHALKSLYGVFVAQPYSAESVLVQPGWQRWFFQLLTDVPNPLLKASTGYQALQAALSGSLKPGMAAAISAALGAEPPRSGSPGTVSTTLPSNNSSNNLASLAASSPSSSSSSPSAPGKPATPTSGAAASASSASSSSSSSGSRPPSPSQHVSPHASPEKLERSTDKDKDKPGGGPPPLLAATSGSAALGARGAISPRPLPPVKQKPVLTDEEEFGNLDEFYCVKVNTYLNGFLKIIHLYAFQSWEAYRFSHLLTDSITLARKFAGGWNFQSISMVRKMLTGLLLKLQEQDVVLSVRNDVSTRTWSNALVLASIICQFCLFTGWYDPPVRKKTSQTLAANPLSDGLGGSERPPRMTNASEAMLRAHVHQLVREKSGDFSSLSFSSPSLSSSAAPATPSSTPDLTPLTAPSTPVSSATPVLAPAPVNSSAPPSPSSTNAPPSLSLLGTPPLSASAGSAGSASTSTPSTSSIGSAPPSGSPPLLSLLSAATATATTNFALLSETEQRATMRRWEIEQYEFNKFYMTDREHKAGFTVNELDLEWDNSFSGEVCVHTSHRHRGGALEDLDLVNNLANCFAAFGWDNSDFKLLFPNSSKLELHMLTNLFKVYTFLAELQTMLKAIQEAKPLASASPDEVSGLAKLAPLGSPTHAGGASPFAYSAAAAANSASSGGLRPPAGGVNPPLSKSASSGQLSARALLTPATPDKDDKPSGGKHHHHKDKGRPDYSGISSTGAVKGAEEVVGLSLLKYRKDPLQPPPPPSCAGPKNQAMLEEYLNRLSELVFRHRKVLMMLRDTVDGPRFREIVMTEGRLIKLGKKTASECFFRLTPTMLYSNTGRRWKGPESIAPLTAITLHNIVSEADDILPSQQPSAFHRSPILDMNVPVSWYEKTMSLVSLNPHVKHYPYAFQISSTAESFVVSAPSAQAKSAWILVLSQCIARAKSEKGRTRGGGGLFGLSGDLTTTISYTHEWAPTPQEMEAAELEQKKNSEINDDAKGASGVAPVYVPKSSAGRCHKCNASFNLFNRKHHCYSCGKVFCNNCTKQKYLLAHINKEKESRVCESCLHTLRRTEHTKKVALAKMIKERHSKVDMIKKKIVFTKLDTLAGATASPSGAPLPDRKTFIMDHPSNFEARDSVRDSVKGPISVNPAGSTKRTGILGKIKGVFSPKGKTTLKDSDVAAAEAEAAAMATSSTADGDTQP